MSDYETFLNLLDLLAETCLGRNEVSQLALNEIYQNKVLMNIFEDRKVNFETRSRTLKLFHALYLDRAPFQPLVVPSETIIWRDLPRLDLRSDALTQAIKEG